jgi:hypothetical protein
MRLALESDREHGGELQIGYGAVVEIDSRRAVDSKPGRGARIEEIYLEMPEIGRLWIVAYVGRPAVGKGRERNERNDGDDRG